MLSVRYPEIPGGRGSEARSMVFDEPGVKIAALRRDLAMCGVQPPDPSKKKHDKAAGYQRCTAQGGAGDGMCTPRPGVGKRIS